MNEKIKLLAEQAIQEVAPGVEYKIMISPAVEKFAELIVAECIEVFGRDLPEPGDGKMLEVINRICNVAEHFGVEE